MAIGQQTSAPNASAADQAQQKAQEAGQQAQQKAQEAGQQAQQKAQEVGQQAQQKAQQAAGEARDRVRGQLDQRTTGAGEQLAGQAGDLRAVADQLREQGKDRPAQIAEQAAQRSEQIGSYLKESDADRIINDVEDFARQRPWAVVGGGIALGFVASRFLKASSADRYRQSTRPAPGTPPSPMSPMSPTPQVTAQTAHGTGVDPALDDGRSTSLGSQ